MFLTGKIFPIPKSGFRLVGNSRLFCSSRGQWMSQLDREEEDKEKEGRIDDPFSFAAHSSLVGGGGIGGGGGGGFMSMRGRLASPGFAEDDLPSSAGVSVYDLLGQVDHLPPSCQQVRCPASPPWGADRSVRVQVLGRRPGDLARYTCPSGLVLRGRQQVTCREDGEWGPGAGKQRRDNILLCTYYKY